ncbi:hypothetical protein FQR65_LT20972 [Abscondita terminalis]|nr:hypothetical protein FQR65_LT20972 [Abscondita terminalis]
MTRSPGHPAFHERLRLVLVSAALRQPPDPAPAAGFRCGSTCWRIHSLAHALGLPLAWCLAFCYSHQANDRWLLGWAYRGLASGWPWHCSRPVTASARSSRHPTPCVAFHRTGRAPVMAMAFSGFNGLFLHNDLHSTASTPAAANPNAANAPHGLPALCPRLGWAKRSINPTAVVKNHPALAPVVKCPHCPWTPSAAAHQPAVPSSAEHEASAVPMHPGFRVDPCRPPPA